MGSDPVGVLTGSILGALTGLLGLGLAFAGRRWTAALVHRAEVESAASNGAEQTSNMPPVDTALVLELLAAQLRVGLAPLAALGTLAEALNSRALHTVCQRLQMGSGWGVPGRGPRREHSVSCGMRSPPPIRAAHPARRYCSPLPMRTASASAARQNAPPESSP